MKASTTICRLVLSFLSQFFQSRRHFSSQAKDRSTSNCSDLWGSTGHQASHRGAAKHGICFVSRLVPSNVNSYLQVADIDRSDKFVVDRDSSIVREVCGDFGRSRMTVTLVFDVEDHPDG